MAINALATLTLLWASTCILVLGEPLKHHANSNVQAEECTDEFSILQTTAAMQAQQKLEGLTVVLQEKHMEINATSREHPNVVNSFENDTHSRHDDKERRLAPSLGYLHNDVMIYNTTLLQSIPPSSLWNDWNIAFKVAVIEVALLFLVVLLRELGLAQEWFGEQEVGPEHRWYMKAAEMGRLAIASCDYTFIIPLSFNLAAELGGSAIASGFIVSSYSAGMAAGTLLSMKVLARHSPARKRRILVLALALAGLSEAALAVVMTIPALKEMAGLTVAIIAVRILGGFASGWGSVHLLMLTTVCTPKEQCHFEAWIPCVDFVGLTSGPLLVALCTSTILAKDFYMQAAPALMCVASLNMVISACISFILPLDLDRVSFHLDQRPWLCQSREYVDFEPDILAAEAVDVIPNKNREGVTVCFFLQVAACGFCTIGQEVATPYIMQVFYGWTIADIAVGMAVVFACAGMFSISLVTIRVQLGTGIDKRIGIPCCLLGIVATILYFTGTFEGFANRYHYFIGDAVLYPCNAFVSGMLLSYAMWASNTERWNHRENVVVTAQVTDAIVKFGGAPLVRGVIASEGRLPYAIMQLVLTIFTLGDFLWARNVELYLETTQLADAVPSGRGFFRELVHRKNRLLKPFRSADAAADADDGKDEGD